jgi:hypothetical protein
MFKRFFVPPLLPVLFLMLLALWVVIDETKSSPRIFDGRPDNAPRAAAMFLLYLTPIFYIIFTFFNFIDAQFDRFTPQASWIASLSFSGLIFILLFIMLYIPEVDSSAFPALGMAMLTAVFIILPMTLLRRLLFTKPYKEPITMNNTNIPTFDTLFTSTNSNETKKANKSQ